MKIEKEFGRSGRIQIGQKSLFFQKGSGLFFVF
jgi:hypothetical protein